MLSAGPSSAASAMLGGHNWLLPPPFGSWQSPWLPPPPGRCPPTPRPCWQRGFCMTKPLLAPGNPPTDPGPPSHPSVSNTPPKGIPVPGCVGGARAGETPLLRRARGWRTRRWLLLHFCCIGLNQVPGLSILLSPRSRHLALPLPAARREGRGGTKRLPTR